tara:strand:- start:1652 stop:2164 length:513 start_codon:yes stop_codon:yes gene_type:complete
MRVFLDKKYLFIIILLISCNQIPENKEEEVINTNESVEAVYEVPIKLSEEFISKYELDDWSELKRLEYYIFVLANSITGYLENDYTYIFETLNYLSNLSTDISKSEFQLYNERPEIKGRLKLLNIQVQKTKLNINNWSKKKGLNELNKIFIFYNYSINSIKSILEDNIIN